MPPRLFWTSITLIQTSLVHLISFLLNSISLWYPKQIFISYITPSPFSIYSETNNLKQNNFHPLPPYLLSSLSSKLWNSGHSIYLPSLKFWNPLSSLKTPNLFKSYSSLIPNCSYFSLFTLFYFLLTQVLAHKKIIIINEKRKQTNK
jgi:hypothetical protein